MQLTTHQLTPLRQRLLEPAVSTTYQHHGAEYSEAIGAIGCDTLVLRKHAQPLTTCNTGSVPGTAPALRFSWSCTCFYSISELETSEACKYAAQVTLRYGLRGPDRSWFRWRRETAGKFSRKCPSTAICYLFLLMMPPRIAVDSQTSTDLTEVHWPFVDCAHLSSFCIVSKSAPATAVLFGEEGQSFLPAVSNIVTLSAG